MQRHHSRQGRAAAILGAIVDEAFERSMLAILRAMERQLGRLPSAPLSEEPADLARLAERRTRYLAKAWKVPPAKVREAIRKGLDGRA